MSDINSFVFSLSFLFFYYGYSLSDVGTGYECNSKEMNYKKEKGT